MTPPRYDWGKGFIVNMRERTAGGLQKGSDWAWPVDWTGPWRRGGCERKRREASEPREESWTKCPRVSQTTNRMCSQNGWVIQRSKAGRREEKPRLELERFKVGCGVRSAGRSPQYWWDLSWVSLEWDLTFQPLVDAKGQHNIFLTTSAEIRALLWESRKAGIMVKGWKGREKYSLGMVGHFLLLIFSLRPSVASKVWATLEQLGIRFQRTPGCW